MSPQSTLHVLGSAIALAMLSSVGVSPAVAAGELPRAQVSSSADQDAALCIWIDDAELMRLIRAGDVILVDVRDESAYTRAHLLGAVSIPLKDVLAHIDELRAAGKTVVTYCAGPVGEKGARAAMLLRSHGLTEARALSGGFANWVSHGNVVEVRPS